ISIFNFHYASPPTAVAQNYQLNKVIGDNETGFKGTNDTHYRMEAWQFMLAGGGLYNNLDYSFVAGHEGGDFVYPKDQPGGGNAAFRKQMRVLSGFIYGFDFVRMKPDQNSISSVRPKETQVHTLAKPGAQYAAYFFSKLSPTASAALEANLKIPPGKYRVEWVDVLLGTVARSETIQVKESPVSAAFPEYKGEAALRVSRVR
ncbi:MAG TPA: hypothetical protein VN673_11025, partial [Clostridia bacterium]|nr:hypothetical protein [Clostridia bacterium]